MRIETLPVWELYRALASKTGFGRIVFFIDEEAAELFLVFHWHPDRTYIGRLYTSVPRLLRDIRTAGSVERYTECIAHDWRENYRAVAKMEA